MMGPKWILKVFQYGYYALSVFSGFMVAICYDYGFNKEALTFLVMSFCAVCIGQIFKTIHSKLP